MFRMLAGGIALGEEEFAHRRDPRGGPGRDVPGLDAHAGALQGLVVHEPALPRRSPTSTWEKQGSPTADERGDRRVEAPARELGGSRDRPGRRRGAAGVHRPPPGRDRGDGRAGGPGAPPRHPLRAGADRAEDASQPLLPGAPLHRLRGREAVDAGRLPGHEGRGRLGGGVHRVLLDQPRERRDAVRLGAAVGRRGRARAVADGRRRPPPRRPGRRRAVARRPVRRGPRVAAAAARPVPDRKRLRRDHRAQGDGRAPTSAASRTTGWRPPGGRAAPASTSSTCTARTPTCRASSSRRSTTAAPTSTAARSRTAPGSGWRRSSACARRVGDDCAIAVRIAADTLDRSGVELDEGLAFIRAADHLVDLWDVTVGAMSGAGADRLRAVALLRAGLSAGVVGPGQARRRPSRSWSSAGSPIPTGWPSIVRGGAADLIGAARPSISDPFLPRKIEEGRYDEIRECIGCNACYSRSVCGSHLGCTQNATAGEEHRRGWHPERFEPAGERRPDGARGGRRPGRDGVRDRAGQARPASSSTWSTPATTWAAACAG